MATTESLLCLLKDPSSDIIQLSLKQLLNNVDTYWPDISESLATLEAIHESGEFKEKKLLALLISKVYYHLGEYSEALNFALQSGTLFDILSLQEFNSVIKSEAINTYMSLRKKGDKTSQEASLLATLEPLLNMIFENCLERREYHNVIGVALQSERLDVIQKTLELADFNYALLGYLKLACLESNIKISFRNQVLFQLVDAYKKASQPDILALSECWVYLNDPASMAQVFKSFTNTSEEKGSQLMAFQAAFHLISIAPQDFIQRVLQTLGNEANNSDSFDAKLVRVLKGDKSRELTLQFLCRNNHIDRYILQQTKSNINAKSSLHHSALTLSHGILQCGTSNDDFLRSNMEFLSYASNWSKFSATASLGLVHMGQVNDGMSLLSAYLPKENQLVGNHGGYAEGGSLLALGLIHGNHGDLHVLKYLLGQLQGHSNAVIQHGAALGIGVSGLASQHTFLIEPLKATLFGDEAVAGEAAALAIGMVMLGTRNAALISELLQYAHDTQHEKIVRGISISIALMLYGCEDEADAIIAQLLHDKDPMLRYGGIYGIALAYAGTSNKGMLEKVLHVAVSDTSDDVRRAAVISIGFLCFKAPEQVPKLVKLLVESYNPHVRFGAAIALGISCCGGIVQAGASANGRNGTSAAHSGYASQALSLLEPLMADMVDFVRQGALIATSMVLIQATEALEPRVTQVRSLYQKIISDKREDVMTKFGAILSQGLIDAGGHNVTLQLSVEGHRRMEGIVGLALFSQFWYWYPMSTFLGLALVPTHITLLDETLKAPKMAINIAGGNKNGTISSLFAYPESTKPQDKKEQAPLVVATLSTTTKAKARLSKKSSSEKLSEKSTEKSGVIETKMEIDPPVLPSANFVNNSSSGKTSLENGSRVLPLQSTLIKFKWEGRFQPILPQLTNGFIMVQDKTYEVPVVYLEESVIEKEPAPLIEEAAVDADAMMEE